MSEVSGHKDLADIIDYVGATANQLGLRDWVFTVELARRKRDYYARITPTQGRRHATIRLCPDFRSLPPPKQRNAIIHELLHLHHRAAADLIRIRLGPKVLSQPVYDLVWAEYQDDEELATDTLASAIDKLFALPRFDPA